MNYKSQRTYLTARKNDDQVDPKNQKAYATLKKTAFSVSKRSLNSHKYISKEKKREHTSRKQNSKCECVQKQGQSSQCYGKCAQRQRRILQRQDTIQLKCSYSRFVDHLFSSIDFDHSDFVTGTKIAYFKSCSQTTFYFFGSVFNKIKKIGAVSRKIFTQMCDQLFIKTSAQDIQALITQEESSYTYFVNSKRQNLQKVKKKQKICLRTEPGYQTYRKVKKIYKELKLPMNSRLVLDSDGQWTRRQNSEHNNNISRSSFDSMRVRLLSQRLDQQLKQCQNRIKYK